MQYYTYSDYFTETKRSCKLKIEKLRIIFDSITFIIQGTKGTVHKSCKLNDTGHSSYLLKMSANPKNIYTIILFSIWNLQGHAQHLITLKMSLPHLKAPKLLENPASVWVSYIFFLSSTINLNFIKAFSF